MYTSATGESSGTAVVNIHPSPPPSANHSSTSLNSAVCQYTAITNLPDDGGVEITDEPGSMIISRASTSCSNSSSTGGGFFQRVRTGLLSRSNTGVSISPTAPASPTTPSSPGELKKQRRKSSGPAVRRKELNRRHSGMCSAAPHYGHGRHSNVWLFGGWSVRETVKSVLSSD